MDFISGRPDHNLANLKDRIFKKDNQAEKYSVYEIVEKISSICYPPANSPSERANDAAFLLILKDELNNLVAPARGQTIAYTTMFAEGRKQSASSRVRIAEEAFPSLIDSAARFRRWKSFLSWIGLIVTITAALLLWHVTYGAQLAAHFDEAKRNDTQAAARLFSEFDKIDAKKAPDLIELCGIPKNPPAPPAGDHSQKPPQNSSQQAEGVTSTVRQLCNEYAYRRAIFCSAIADVGAYSESWIFKVSGWLLPIYGVQAAGDCAEGDVANPQPPAHAGGGTLGDEHRSRPRVGRQEDAQSIAGVLATMSNYILPILFGLVGTIAALVRGIQDKIRDSVLAPRDFALLLIRLPLGMIAGVCVGLFMNPTTVSSQLNGTLGTFTITASGIAFLAGYGADLFFRALDTVLGRIFTLEGGTRDRKAVP